jgi:hypothetical protein
MSLIPETSAQGQGQAGRPMVSRQVRRLKFW